MNLYDRLGITAEEKKLQGKPFEDVVKRQYRAYATQHHPDKFQDPKEKEEATTKFQGIAEAKDVLSDSQKRMQYDMTGSTSGFNFQNFNSRADIDDILQSFFHGGGHWGFRQQHQPQQQIIKGQDVVIRITLDIKDVYKGTEKKYKFKRGITCSHCEGVNLQTCYTCKGSGMVTTSQQMGGTMFFQQTNICPHCQGTGKTVQQNSKQCSYCKNIGVIEKEEIVTLQIPRGITKGVTLSREGMGHQLPKGYSGVSGDLKIVIGNITSDLYQVDNYNLVRYLDVPILDIITGTSVDITTPVGEKIKVDIPQNFTNTGSLMLGGYGIPHGNQKSAGDIYLVIKHKFPTILDSSDKKKIEELKKSKNFK